MDNLAHLGEMLLRRKRCDPDVKLVTWKSDITEAYRACPMHKLWQIKQVIRIRGRLRVDRANLFGGLGSGAIFISLNAFSGLDSG